MNKEKILESARENGHVGKEFENKEAARSSMLGFLVATIVGVALYLLEYFIKGTNNLGMIAIGMTAFGVQYLYEGIKVKVIYKIIMGIIITIIAICAILVFIWQVMLP